MQLNCSKSFKLSLRYFDGFRAARENHCPAGSMVEVVSHRSKKTEPVSGAGMGRIREKEYNCVPKLQIIFVGYFSWSLCEAGPNAETS